MAKELEYDDEWQPDDRAEMEAMLEKAARPRESWLAA